MTQLRAVAVFVASIAILGGTLAPLTATAQQPGGKEVVMLANQMQFKEVAPGVSKTVLWGDADSGPYGALTKFKAGTKNALHTHANDLRIVVFKGAYVYEADGKKTRIGPGSYMLVPGGKPHVSGAIKDTLFFEESSGKFDLTFVPQPGK